MPTRYSIEVHVPIPPELSPAQVVATLQTFEPLLDHHGYVVEYRPKRGPIEPKDLAVIKGDPFFQDEWHDLTTPDTAASETDSRWWICDVWEDVYWVPFIVPYFSRLKRYLAVGCKIEGGIRFRQAVSGGVVTRGTFTVVSRETGCAYVPGDDGNWDADTEKGSIAPSAEGGTAEGQRVEDQEERDGERAIADERKESRNWDAQTETGVGAEPAWDIVCACKIEMPLILIMSQILRRDANRALCEHLCKAIISDTVLTVHGYHPYRSNSVST
ncbi:hypothetical protein F5Y03DRAFT_342897 [Xylaria venustula]|nr:hypothetical protein F5Y03DRAFT_342897 [Xylaria venustula]